MCNSFCKKMMYIFFLFKFLKHMYDWNLCVSISEDVCFQNTITLPPNILDYCTSKNKSFPLFFKLKSEYKVSYHSVKEFTAEENYIVLAKNIADELHLTENQIINISLQWNIPFAKFVVFEPKEEKFFNESNIDEILEKQLSLHSILYPKQTIKITLPTGIFSILVKEIEPDWSKVKLDTFRERCYNIIDQNIEVQIYNSFFEEMYYRKQKDEKNECNERKKMQSEDFNYCEPPKRILPSKEEIREMRMKKFSKK